MARTDRAPSGPDALEPRSIEDAIRSLDDGAFVELVVAVWERRGWTVEEVRDPESWYVDLALHDGWPVERRALARLKRPDARREVSGTDVRHFVRTVQGAEVDGGILILPTVAPESARSRAEKLNVEVVGSEDLARLVDEWGVRDVLERLVDGPLVAESGPAIGRAPRPTRRALERSGVERVGRVVDRLLPADPTPEDVAELTFVGVRIGLLLAAATFLVAVLASGSSLSWLPLGLFVLVTYVGLLPLLAADIYLVRRFEPTEWTPSWWSLASFVLAPLLFVVGAIYWYRRREQYR